MELYLNFKHFFSAIFGGVICIVYFTFISESYSPNPQNDNTQQEHVTQTTVPLCNSLASKSESLKKDSLEAEKISELEATVMHLQSVVESLEYRLELKETIKTELAKVNTAVDKINKAREQIDTALQGAEWSEAEIEEAYPAPFDRYVKKTKGTLREDYQSFQVEPTNHEWAFDMEAKIRDFFTLHEMAYLVEINILECKTYRCQIGVLVSEPEKKPGKRIFDQMTLEPWFIFQTHSRVSILDNNIKTVGVLFFFEGLPL